MEEHVVGEQDAGWSQKGTGPSKDLVVVVPIPVSAKIEMPAVYSNKCYCCDMIPKKVCNKTAVTRMEYQYQYQYINISTSYKK